MKAFSKKYDITILTYIKVILISFSYFIIVGLSLGFSAVGMNDLRISF